MKYKFYSLFLILTLVIYLLNPHIKFVKNITFENLPEDAIRHLKIVGINNSKDYEKNGRYKFAIEAHINHKPMYFMYLILLLTVVSSIIARLIFDLEYILEGKHPETFIMFYGSMQIEAIILGLAYVLILINSTFFVRNFYNEYIKPYCLSLKRLNQEEYYEYL